MTSLEMWKKDFRWNNYIVKKWKMNQSFVPLVLITCLIRVCGKQLKEDKDRESTCQSVNMNFKTLFVCLFNDHSL